MSLDPHPPLLAVDANGYCWRAYADDYWSMCPVNPDNSPIPRPVTYYVPVTEGARAALESTPNKTAQADDMRSDPA